MSQLAAAVRSLLPRDAQTRALLVILALALGLRLAWVAFSGWQPVAMDDATRYDFSAHALADGLGYIHLNGEPTAFWPPGYPLLLSGLYVVFGSNILVAQLFNVALSTASVWLAYVIGREALGARAGLAGAALTASFPSLIIFTAVTLSETVFLFLVLLAVYLVLRERRRDERDLRLLGAAGVVLGFASLTRGQALLLPAVFAGFWWLSGAGPRRTALGLAATVAGVALIVAPWTVRNAIQMDAPVLISTNAGVAFWAGHNEDANGTDGVLYGEELVYRHPELSTVEREVRVSNEGFREGIEYAVTHPGHEVELLWQKFRWLYRRDDDAVKWNEGHRALPFLGDGLRAALHGLSNAYYFAVVTVAGLSIARWWSRRDPKRALLIGLAVYWTVVHVAFLAEARYHVPALPLFALWAGAGLAALWPRPGRLLGPSGPSP